MLKARIAQTPEAATDKVKLAADDTPQLAPTGQTGMINEAELLRRLPISRRTAFNWVKDGKLPCIKIGRRKIYHWPSCESALLRLQRGGIE
jgi:hypothetical protein